MCVLVVHNEIDVAYSDFLLIYTPEYQVLAFLAPLLPVSSVFPVSSLRVSIIVALSSFNIIFFFLFGSIGLVFLFPQSFLLILFLRYCCVVVFFVVLRLVLLPIYDRSWLSLWMM